MAWFGRSYNHFKFEVYSVSHILILIIFIFVTIGIFLSRGKFHGPKWRRMEIGIALSLLLIEATYHVWLFVNANWKVSHAIPLELCSISLILSVILLLTGKTVFLEILLFTALLGSTQAILFPSLHYGFPHFRFFHFFYTHMMVVWVALYSMYSKEFRLTFMSVIKLWVFLNILMPIILYINKLTNGNYLYLSHKPSHMSLLDLLGPYPWYILSMEALVIILSLILWLIFRKKGKENQSSRYY
ncbi:TIGR02206 family membrane protein [Neobacillus sp. FSL H8-0543]|uniref:TMEM164-related integral membrane acyltransferase n=1 Tax=Neobacillus sp. FSL H8-0543 TaxID=2954672 RepID=UPI00315872D5